MTFKINFFQNQLMSTLAITFFNLQSKSIDYYEIEITT